jgi:hypothetical protein
MKKVLLVLAAALVPAVSHAAPPNWMAMKTPEKLQARPGKSRFQGAAPVMMKSQPGGTGDETANYNFFQMTATEQSQLRDAVASPDQRRRSPKPAPKRPIVDPASEPRI